jgi:hypothetical protein
MRVRNILWLKIVVHVAALIPLATLIWAFWRSELGPG